MLLLVLLSPLNLLCFESPLMVSAKMFYSLFRLQVMLAGCVLAKLQHSPVTGRGGQLS